MRYDPDHKGRTRERVIEAAARSLRAHGPKGVGVADIMGQAGLTPGGFYAHFRSKDALIAEAVASMFKTARRRFVYATAGKAPAAGLAAYIDWYLSEAHRDARETGCPLAALVSDLSRANGIVREIYGEGVSRLSRALADALRDLGREDAETLARSALAELIGALSLARAVADPEQSRRILASAREALNRRLGIAAAP
jgi:TetR/AcrR family transcriptional repressor of nem operon